LREGRRLRVFQNRVLKRIFGPKRDEVTGEWRKLHNEELNDLNFSPNIIRVIKSKRMRWAGHVALWGIGEACTGFWRGNVRGKRPFVRPRRRWADNIKIDLQEVGYGGMNWIELVRVRDMWRELANGVMNVRVP
jgi:hypothetical protein